MVELSLVFLTATDHVPLVQLIVVEALVRVVPVVAETDTFFVVPDSVKTSLMPTPLQPVVTVTAHVRVLLLAIEVGDIPVARHVVSVTAIVKVPMTIPDLVTVAKYEPSTKPVPSEAVVV